MAKVRVVPSSAGYREIMNGAGVMGEVGRITDEIESAANAMGHGRYYGDVLPGESRCHGRVRTTDVVSRVDNARNNTLLKAMGRCRG